jgi:hypothetical protein
MSKSLIESTGAHPRQLSRREVFPLFDETLLVCLELCDVLPDLVSLRSNRNVPRWYLSWFGEGSHLDAKGLRDYRYFGAVGI